jgi:tripartite ATP-independent transporter DctP family solute receptor
MSKKKELTRRDFLKSTLATGAVIGGGSLLAGSTMAAPAKAPSKKLQLKFANHTPAQTTIGQLCDKFADLVKQKSNGEIIVNVYHGAQLGGEKDQIEGVRLGTVDLGYSSGVIAQWFPAWGVAELPFLYKDYDQACRALSGPFIETFNPKLQTLGFRIVGVGSNTPRQTLSKKGLKTLADWKGVKIRVPEYPVFIETFKALGAVPTPVASPEAYNALQSGMVEAIESAVDYLYSNKWYEICGYLNMTAHIINSEAIVMGESWFRRQPESVQKVLLDSGKEVYNFFKTKRLETANEFIKKIVDAGLTKIEPDREELAKAVQPLQQAFADKYQIRDLLEKMRNA